MTSERRDLAIVLCVHHKPWLIMSTIVTVLMQDYPDADIFVIYQLGNGHCPGRASYATYHDLASRYGRNTHLSDFDPRVRPLCQLRGRRVHELEFENDAALDSGAWYKFVRAELWRPYKYVLFMGEGTLLTRSTSLSGMMDFARTHDAHFLASGHEKRRVPRSLMLSYNSRVPGATAMEAFHDEMIRETFGVFCRDAAFRALFDAWGDDGPAETQNHVPDIWPRTTLGYRLWLLANARRSAADGGLRAWVSDRMSRWRPRLLANGEAASEARIHVNGRRRLARDVVDTVESHGLRFHKVDEAEWFGCTVAHLMSGTFLERLFERLRAHNMYDALDLPFAATGLEVVWGFLPRWLGFDKWFTDATHRVRKNFVTYRREDDPETMSAYINCYHRGQVTVAPAPEALLVRALHPSFEHVRRQLPDQYFSADRLAA